MFAAFRLISVQSGAKKDIGKDFKSNHRHLFKNKKVLAVCGCHGANLATKMFFFFMCNGCGLCCHKDKNKDLAVK